MSGENLLSAPAQRKAIIAMSGGVDSSVAALLCQQAGYDCLGVTLALTDNSDRGQPEGHAAGIGHVVHRAAGLLPGEGCLPQARVLVFIQF